MRPNPGPIATTWRQSKSSLLFSVEVTITSGMTRLCTTCLIIWGTANVTLPAPL